MTTSSTSTSVWKVLGFYIAGSWIVLQVIDVLAQNVGLPPWVFSLALALLIVGLPILGATAYLQGLGSGAHPEGEGGQPSTAPRRMFTWRNAMLGGGGALALWGLLVTGWLVTGRGQAEAGAGGLAIAGADLRSVAVLPFDTRATSTDEEALIFSEGMHDDLLTQLSKVESLTVISRTSVMRYAGTTKPIPEIADELGVATVLEGGVQRSGDRVRVNVQLIEASSDRHLWAETYDEELTAANIFAIQSDLSRKIAGALRATLTPEIEARLESRPTESLEAFDYHARAQHILNNVNVRNPSVLAQAEKLVDLALEADSTYAEAWASKARLYASRYSINAMSLEEMLGPAHSALDRALSLDPNLSVAYSYRGGLLLSELRFDEAEVAYLRAIELNPGSAEEHRTYSRMLVQLGRVEQAVQESRRAVELDPLSLNGRASYADALFWAEDWSGTEAESLKLLEMDPTNHYAYYNLGFARTMLGRVDQGVEAFERARALEPADDFYPAGLAWALAVGGERERALDVLADLPPEGRMLKEIAIVHATLGDLDAAFEALDRLLEEDPEIIGQLRTDPTADPLKDDPRYVELLSRVGLTP